MRAYQIPKGGAGIESVVQVERSDPKPGHRQVLVKVKACSLNFRDLGIVRGTYRMPVRENVIPLSDGAGEVVEVGPGVLRVKGGRSRRRQFLSALAGRRVLARGARQRAGRRHRRHAGRIRAAGRRRRGENSGASVAGGGRDTALRRRHGLARHDGARQAQGRRHRSAAGHRRRLDLRTAIRPCHGHPRHRHVVERREA